MSYSYRQETSEVELAALTVLAHRLLHKKLGSFRFDDYAEYFQNINNSCSSWFHGRKLLPFTILWLKSLNWKLWACVHQNRRRRATRRIWTGFFLDSNHSLLIWKLDFLRLKMPTFGLSMARNSRSSIEKMVAELVHASDPRWFWREFIARMTHKHNRKWGKNQFFFSSHFFRFFQRSTVDGEVHLHTSSISMKSDDYYIKCVVLYVGAEMVKWALNEHYLFSTSISFQTNLHQSKWPSRVSTIMHSHSNRSILDWFHLFSFFVFSLLFFVSCLHLGSANREGNIQSKRHMPYLHAIFIHSFIENQLIIEYVYRDM